jgi:predicted nuclease of predicted toxin-antitoxin system
MKLLLDESVPLRLADLLVAQGHDVTAIGRDHPRALADRDVLDIAYRGNAF